MNYKQLFLAVLFTSVFVQAQDSKEKLEHVIEDFRVSIIKHNDLEKFSNLFLHDSITWSAIFTNLSKKMVLRRRPDFILSSSDYKTFYKNLADGSEEKFYNIDMDVRDEFATVSFDYTLAVNEEIKNWGTEYWSLMLVNDSWKITSVTWTMNIQQLEECPFVSDDFFVLK
ncbi:hypothetical protein [uncultured Aquimarina sp.]|uniref:hypothetical protein n=1 Tax=uncultured Aquimarina sp. TaxID=575652 RepID=UPI002615CB73|nr:hypothetical protein [uncultured Aquimarina sp.]